MSLKGKILTFLDEMSSHVHRLQAVYFFFLHYWFFNGIQTNAGYDNTEHALTSNLTYVYFFNTFCLSEKIKDKCISNIQKKIIMKIIIWLRESYKTLTWIWMVLAGPSVSQTCVGFQSLLRL